ncbi:hypothetical protein TB2_043925 [Malus domestica]
MFTETLMACPTDRISRGQISLGTNYPNAPQDHANAATYAQIENKIRLASVFVKDPTPLSPNFMPIITPTATYSACVEEHLHTTLKEQHPSSKLIDCENGHRGSNHVNTAGDDCGH